MSDLKPPSKLDLHNKTVLFFLEKHIHAYIFCKFLHTHAFVFHQIHSFMMNEYTKIDGLGVGVSGVKKGDTENQFVRP